MKQIEQHLGYSLYNYIIVGKSTIFQPLDMNKQNLVI